MTPWPLFSNFTPNQIIPFFLLSIIPSRIDSITVREVQTVKACLQSVDLNIGREEGLYRIYQLLRERNIKHCYSLSSMLGFLDLLHFVKPGNNMVCQCLPPKRNIIIKMKSGTLRATPHSQEISGNEVAFSLFMIFPC